jgi:hypothetical protein
LNGLWQTTSTTNKLTNLTVDNNIVLGGAILQNVKTATTNVLSNNTTISGDTTITGSLVCSGSATTIYNSSFALFNSTIKQLYDTATILTNDFFAKTIFSNGIKLLNTSSIELNDGTSITQNDLKSIATINTTLEPVSYVNNEFAINADKITLACVPNALELSLSFDTGLKYNGASVDLSKISTNTEDITAIKTKLEPVTYVANSFKIDTDKITFDCTPNIWELSYDGGLKYNNSSVSLLDIATNKGNIATNTGHIATNTTDIGNINTRLDSTYKLADYSSVWTSINTYQYVTFTHNLNAGLVVTNEQPLRYVLLFRNEYSTRLHDITNVGLNGNTGYCICIADNNSWVLRTASTVICQVLNDTFTGTTTYNHGFIKLFLWKTG